MQDGTMCTFANVYLPPHNNLGRRNLSEDTVRDACLSILGRIDASNHLLVAGDFNARTGQLVPAFGDVVHTPRVSSDHVVCPRGKWLLEVCEMFSLMLLNGCFEAASGQLICIKHNGGSICDYILLRGTTNSFSVCPEVLGSLSDHCALTCTLPWVPTTTRQQDCTATVVYRWVDGTSLSNYSDSWRAWEQHTDTQEFAQKLSDVANCHVGNIDELSHNVEQLLIDEALAVGVVKKVVLKHAPNPNKAFKKLAPWFNDACK